MVLGGACARRPAHPNVVLISIDSLRADHLSCYGYPRPTTPSIDGLARRSVLYDATYSTSTWTLPAHMTMLTGLYPETHGVVDDYRALNHNVPLLSEVLEKAGYHTEAVVSGHYLHRKYGYERGWAHYDQSILDTKGVGPETSELTYEGAIRALDRSVASQKPFFLFLHFFDVHYDYVPPPPFDRLFDPDYKGEVDAVHYYPNPAIHDGMDPRDLRHIVALYDGEIRWVDSWLGRFFDTLRRQGMLRDALVIVTADHGDEFFEHGRKGHRQNLYDTTLRVPLVIHFPGDWQAGRKVHVPVSLVDLAPTVAAWTGARPAPDWQGENLASRWLGGWRDPRPTDLYAGLVGRRAAIIRGDRKLMVRFVRHDPEPGTLRLYDLARDPGELDDLAARDPATAARLLADLERAMRRLRWAGRDFPTRHMKPVNAFGHEKVRELRALGYL